MRFVIVHGFNVRDGGRNTTDQLIPYIRAGGHDVDEDEGDYGYFNIWMIRMFKAYRKSRVLYRLAKAFETADVILDHSNGGNFTTQALDMMGPDYNNKILVIHISPALNYKTQIPGAVRRQLVLHTKHDFWVKLATFIPFKHPWGRMGAVGYQGNDNRNTNVKDNRIPGHSAWFNPRWKRTTWKYCQTFILEHTK